MATEHFLKCLAQQADYQCYWPECVHAQKPYSFPSFLRMNQTRSQEEENETGKPEFFSLQEADAKKGTPTKQKPI